MRTLWNAAVDLLYPPTCCACQQLSDRRGFCPTCRVAIPRVGSPLCTICGIPFRTSAGEDHPCGACLDRRPRFRRARAGTLYATRATATDPLKTVLQRYKYNREVGLAVPLANLIADAAPVTIGNYDVIVPVPLHIDRLRWRGFNQALLLARQLTDGRRIDPFSLQRRRPTRPQVGLTDSDRRLNVHNAFRVTRPSRIRDRVVLLVDDVYTTGATVEACSEALLEAGAAEVDVLVLARAV